RQKQKGRALEKANQDLRRRIRFASILDPNIEDVLASVADGEILLLKTGPVPPALFEWLFRHSTVPPTLEGANAVNLARLMGIPYLPVTDSMRNGLHKHIDIRGI